MRVPSPFPQHFTPHQSSSHKGFGKTHPFLFQFIKQYGQEEGFLTDPIYSGQIIFGGKRLLSSSAFKGNVLIHSFRRSTLLKWVSGTIIMLVPGVKHACSRCG